MAAPNRPDDPDAALEVEVNGRKTTVRLDAFTGADVKACRAETGHPPRYWFQHPDDMDIDVIAVFVWLERRKQQASLTYDQVLASVDYTNVNVIDDAGDSVELADDPEA